MTLTTHALVGAAAAQLFPTSPYLAFAAGFASHIAIDSLPHWDYDGVITSFTRDAENPLNNNIQIGGPFITELSLMGLDALLGLVSSVAVFSVWFFHAPMEIVLVGAMAGLLPDALQFVYFKTRSRLLLPLQRLHTRVQEGKSIKSPTLGLWLQASLVVSIIALQKMAT